MAADHGEGGEGHAGDGNSIMDEGRSTEVSSLIAAEAAEVEFRDGELLRRRWRRYFVDSTLCKRPRSSDLAGGCLHVAAIWRETATRGQDS